jgi:amino acid adenylation domain-containing protein
LQSFEESAPYREPPAAPDSAALTALPARQASAYPGRLAYAILDDKLEVAAALTFAELAARAEALAAALVPQTSPGDPVLLAFNNGLDPIVAFWGCLYAGLVPVPAPAPDSTLSRTSQQRLAGIAADAHIAVALTDDCALEDAREQLAGVRWYSVAALLRDAAQLKPMELRAAPDEVAYLQYTSGSTSEPRAVEITHAAVLAQCRALDESVAVDHEQDRALIWLPWFHDYGLLHALILPVYEGIPSYVMPTLGFMRQPLRWLTAISKYKITHTGAPNFAYQACTRALARSPGWSGSLETLRVASCGAEPVRRNTLDAFRTAFAPYGLSPRALAPSYGLAEAVLVVSLARSGGGPGYLRVRSRALEQHCVEPVVEGDAADVTELVSCGAPLPGFDVRIVDPVSAEPCEPASVGEIWVSGPSVGRGYRGHSAATEQTFRATLTGAAGQHYLRTGDLGFLHQGELFVTGRLKDLLVVHGRNLYPQDLEKAAEAAHGRVRPAGVIACGVAGDDGRESVVLLIECQGRPEPAVVAEIKASIRRAIAGQFELDVAEVVPLRSGSLPRTSSGKLQRAAAARLYRDNDFADRRLATAAVPDIDTVTVRDVVLELVLNTWAEVLDQPLPESDADFFDQGGDSLLATQIASRLNAHLSIELPVRAVFEARRPDALAQLAREAETRAALPISSAADPTRPRLLSFTQERMWFIHQLAPESPAYNVPLALRLRGPINTQALQQSINRFVARHQVLQSVFAAAAAGPRATVENAVAAPMLQEIDLSGSGSAPLEAAAGVLGELASEPFELAAPPLVRICLVHLGNDDALLLWVMHHIVGDQWSCAVLGQELAAGYRAALEGTTADNAELPLQYADYAEWQRAWFSGARRQRQLDYWRRQLAGLAPLELNTDFPRSRQQSFAGAAVHRPLDAERLRRLKQLAAEHGVSLSMLLMAAFKVLLLRHTGATDIAIGVPVANRHHLSTEALVGSFVNTLVFRTDLSGKPDFVELLRRVREVSLQAFEHQDMPFEVLVRELDLPHDLSRSPLFDVMFNMINTPVRDVNFPGLTWQRFDFDRRAAQFDLTVNVDVLYAPAIVFEYATALFAPETAERLIDQYLTILDTVVERPGIEIGAIDCIAPDERRRLREWGSGLPAPAVAGSASISQQVAAHAARHPDSPALVFADRTVSYAALDAAAERIAMTLRSRGCGRGRTVGVCLPRSPAIVEALLGVLRSGAAYVPLDPAYPVERLRYQARDAGVDLLLADVQTASYLDWPTESTLLIEAEAPDPVARAGGLPADAASEAGPEDPAYIIYTSGSTGKPKGVQVPHRAVVNFLDSMRAEPGLCATDRLLAVTTIGFDIAVLELLLPLTSGACVVLASETEAADGWALATLIASQNVTVMQATPSRWHMLLEAGWQGAPQLKALVGGEPLSPGLASRLLERCGEVWNMYGPTETTVWSSCWKVPAAAVEPVALGRPILGTTLQVLDEQGRACPIGVPGELCIGGRGLTLGYRNQPELTARQFINAGGDAVFPGEPLYRTGDRARWRHDGRLEHLGRFDNQLKLRGYRIEPGEIESRLAAHPQVAQAHVTVSDDADGKPQLIAYLTAADEGADESALRAYLRQWLPEHMVPKLFCQLDALPLLENGKINRAALPAPDYLRDAQARLPGSNAEPQQLLEFAVLRIWGEVLESDDIGIHDNFFDLGGHSIIAVDVVQRIQAELDVDCPLPLLFHCPTVAQLAAALGEGARPDAEVAVRRLTSGRAPALFCLSGTEQYRRIAEQLHPGVPVFGLLSAPEAALLERGDRLPPVTELATIYRAAIRRLQPSGPYRIMGYSIGGIIAFEVAQQLRAEGGEVELVALLDSALPGFGPRHIWRWFKRRVLQVILYADVYLQRALQRARARAAGGHGVRSEVYPEYVRITRQYTAGRWDGSLLFVQAEADPITEPGYGWQQHAPAMQVLRVPGDHMGILHGAAAEDVAVRLQAQFDSAAASSPNVVQLRYIKTDESP